MEFKSVFDPAFMPYGRIITGYDFAPLTNQLWNTTEKPGDHTIYVATDPALEALPIFTALTNGFYGGMPIQIGYCNGENKKLNCLEYHRDSELNVSADDILLLVASLQKVKDGKLYTREVEAFYVPAGTAVQLYETTLHYAPVTPPGGVGFRVAVILPRGTNTEKPENFRKNSEDRLLWARNKWLIAHPETAEAKQGAFVGLMGKNITIE